MWHLLRSGVWEATYGDGNWELVPENGLNYCVFRRLKSPRRNHCEGDFWPNTKHKTKLILKTNKTACLIYVYMTARRSAEYLRFESWDLTKRSVVDQNNSLGLWLNDSFFTHSIVYFFMKRDISEAGCASVFRIESTCSGKPLTQSYSVTNQQRR